MKLILLPLTFLSYAFAQKQEPVCQNSLVQCAKNYTFDISYSCMEKTGFKEYHYRACEEGYQCGKFQEDKDKKGHRECEKVGTPVHRYNGQSCDSVSKCISDLNCVNGVCVLEKDNCTATSACPGSTHCYQGKCQNLTEIGGDCSNSRCVNNAECWQLKNKCTKAYSIKNGEQFFDWASKNDTRTIHDTNMLCESGYAYKGVCRSYKLNQESDKCSSANSTCSYVLDDDDKTTFELNCGCSRNDASAKYCKMPVSDPFVKKFQTEYLEYLNGDALKKNPTVAYDEMPVSLKNKRKMIDSSPLYREADACGKWDLIAASADGAFLKISSLLAILILLI